MSAITSKIKKSENVLNGIYQLDHFCEENLYS